mmetsp:Transcript_10504/g.33597  ORF Transcript_10504/g.33597 Transcript_10504/m.33597 type:complete len:214 (+) Transcript_10504:238-879(+)
MPRIPRRGQRALAKCPQPRFFSTLMTSSLAWCSATTSTWPGTPRASPTELGKCTVSESDSSQARHLQLGTVASIAPHSLTLSIFLDSPKNSTCSPRCAPEGRSHAAFVARFAKPSRSAGPATRCAKAARRPQHLAAFSSSRPACSCSARKSSITITSKSTFAALRQRWRIACLTCCEPRRSSFIELKRTQGGGRGSALCLPARVAAEGQQLRL